MAWDRLRALLDRLAAEKVPGCACVVRHQGEIVFEHRAGVRDLESGEAFSLNDRMYVYSISKIATCTAALQQLEAGKFLLSDPVGEYLPAFKEMTVRVTDAHGTEHIEKAQKPLTVRHLFSMTGGLDYNLQAPAIQEVIRATGGRAPTLDVVEAIAKTPLSFDPGTRWQYSLCHDVLAGLVEAVSGERFSEYMRRHVFEPCGMVHTQYHPTEEMKAAAPTQYRYDDALGKPLPAGQDNVYELGTEYDSGGAGIFTSAAEYSRLVDALCHRGTAAGGEQILAPSTVDLMRTSVLPECFGYKPEDWTQLAGYGYGLGVRTMVNRSLGGSLGPVGEFGWGGAAGCYAMIDPENELSAFYAQYMLNNQEPYIHPRVRNTLYADFARLK